jgi:hypothetical protein
MSIAEFLAWFAGYTEHIKRRPSAQQWARVAENVAKVEGGAPFKAWFEGFTAKIKGPPGPDDWRAITARVREEQAAAHATKVKPNLLRLFEDKAARFSASPKLQELYLRGRKEGRE